VLEHGVKEGVDRTGSHLPSDGFMFFAEISQ
jgi:hypothetical protein